MVRAILFGMAALALLVTPASARLWKPTPAQLIQDYTVIDHNKGEGGHVVIRWQAAPAITAPTLQDLMNKYVVLNITDYKFFGGAQVWNDITGVQVTDGAGQVLKEISGDAMPPTLVGIIASSDAAAHAATQGKAKSRWLVFEAGSVNACAAGKLLITYQGETYNYDLPMVGCPKK